MSLMLLSSIFLRSVRLFTSNEGNDGDKLAAEVCCQQEYGRVVMIWKVGFQQSQES